MILLHAIAHVKAHYGFVFMAVTSQTLTFHFFTTVPGTLRVRFMSYLLAWFISVIYEFWRKLGLISVRDSTH